MSNIFADGSLWSDGTSSPPAAWNGTFFEFLACYQTGNGNCVGLSCIDGNMHYIGPPVTEQLSFVCTDHLSSAYWNVCVDGAAFDPLTSVPPYACINFVLGAPMVSGGSCAYAVDFELRAGPAGRFWQDRIGCEEL